MKCRKCLRPIEADSRFCRHCGLKVVRVIAAGVTAASEATVKIEAPAQRRGERNGSNGRGSALRASGANGAVATMDAPPPEPQPPVPSGDVYRDPQFEQSIWQGRPAWRAGMGNWLLWFLLSGCSLYGASRYTAGASSLVQVVWIFVIGAAVMLCVREGLIVYGLSYQLTTQRLFLHRGVLTRVTDQVELIRIDDVRLMRSVTDRLMNTGNVDVFSSDETDETIQLKSISAPVEVAEAIRLHVRRARAKGTLSVESI